MTKFINQEVEVNGFYFAQGKNFKSFPRQITLGTQRFVFNDGLQMLVQKGQDVIRLFDMTDGQASYRLRNEGSQWILITMKTA
jgi:hypothetical protein